MSALPPKADIRKLTCATFVEVAPAAWSMFAAICRASSLLSSLAVERQHAAGAQSAGLITDPRVGRRKCPVHRLLHAVENNPRDRCQHDHCEASSQEHLHRKPSLVARALIACLARLSRPTGVGRSEHRVQHNRGLSWHRQFRRPCARPS